MPYELDAPEGFWKLGPVEKSAICNGMGAKDSRLSRFIPNSMLFLDVKEAADIHDYMYHVGTTIEDKKDADRYFLINLLKIINDAGGLLAFPRRCIALKYYEAVHYGGEAAFYKGKLNV